MKNVWFFFQTIAPPGLAIPQLGGAPISASQPAPSIPMSQTMSPLLQQSGSVSSSPVMNTQVTAAPVAAPPPPAPAPAPGFGKTRSLLYLNHSCFIRKVMLYVDSQCLANKTDIKYIGSRGD